MQIVSPTMKESFPLLDAPAGTLTGDGASEGAA